jgi:hypothetical protein
MSAEAFFLRRGNSHKIELGLTILSYPKGIPALSAEKGETRLEDKAMFWTFSTI